MNQQASKIISRIGTTQLLKIDEAEGRLMHDSNPYFSEITSYDLTKMLVDADLPLLKNYDDTTRIIAGLVNCVEATSGKYSNRKDTYEARKNWLNWELHSVGLDYDDYVGFSTQ